MRLGETSSESSFQGPTHDLETRLSASYREHFGALKYQVPPLVPAFRGDKRPHIVFLVVESWRRDAVTPALMPRLHAWSEAHAHVFQKHEASTYSSEAGMFSLLYGRNNLTFHETLDARVPPLLFSWLRSMNYEVSYYTGHPIKWLRREEFLSGATVDRLVHNDDGNWPDWDKNALAAMNAHVGRAKSPAFSLVFLMSTHFEYQYPPQYERHLPVAKSKFQVTDVNAMSEADRVPHFNRYKNSLAFLDDALMDSIEELPQDTVVVVVGDHGESFFEGGNYGHGFSFTDPVLHVPLLIRFPRGEGPPFDSPKKVSQRTLHSDVIGWLARYLNEGGLFLDGFEGHQEWGRGHASVLSTYADADGKRTYAMLSVRTDQGEELRARLAIRNDEPRLRLLGFEDRYGVPVSAPKLDAARGICWSAHLKANSPR